MTSVNSIFPATALPTVSPSSGSAITNIASQFNSLLSGLIESSSPDLDHSPNQLPSGGQNSSFSSGVSAFFMLNQTTVSSSGTSSPPPLFASIDTGGNGLIERGEFESKFGSAGNQAAADQLFDILDRNADNVIDGTELAASKATSTNSGSSGLSSQMIPVNWTSNSLFTLLPGMQAAKIPNSSNQPLFTKLDTDQNGLLSPAEFGAAFGSSMAQASAYESIDSNQNGSLDWSELNTAQLQSTSEPPGITSQTTIIAFYAQMAGPSTQSSSGSGVDPTSSTGTDSSSATTTIVSSSSLPITPPSKTSTSATSATTQTSTDTSVVSPTTASMSDTVATEAPELSLSQTSSSQTIMSLEKGLLDSLSSEDVNSTANDGATTTT